MERKLSFKVLDITYEAFDESIWDVVINGLDLKVRCGDNCLTTEDHLELKGKTIDAPLGLEFVQLDSCKDQHQVFELQTRASHLRTAGSEVLVSGRIAKICSEELLLLEGLVPLYLHIDPPYSGRLGDFVQARGLLCIMLDET